MADTSLFHGDLVNTKRLIYTPSEFAKMSLLHIQEIGHLQATKPHTSKRDYLASYLLFVVSSGSGTLTYEGTKYKLNTGSCVFIDTRKPYSHTTADDLWNISWLHFDGPTAANIYQKYKERGGLPAFSSDYFERYQELLNNMYNIATGNSYIRDMEINTMISSIISLLMADAWHPDSSTPVSKKNSTLEIKSFLDNNYTKKIALNDIANKFNVNKYYLTRIFKEQFGISIMDYVLSVRITEAKNLLRFTNLGTEEIGIRTGIGDAYYFSRVFKKVEGINIREYRKQWR